MVFIPLIRYNEGIMTKILLVEDDKSLREIYGVRLLAEGYDIVSAGDGEEALAMAIKERPQLVLSDVMMPKISGFDMLDILRSTTETKDIKVIMMTALSSEDQRTRGEALGADRYLVKSQVGIEDVVRTVHDVLGDTAGASAAPIVTAAPTAVPVTSQPSAMPTTSEDELYATAAVGGIAAPAPAATTPAQAVTSPSPQLQGTTPTATPFQSDTSSSLPQPTAPFSTDRPASFGAPTIQQTPTQPEPIADPAAAATPAPQSSSPFGTTIQPLSQQRPQPVQSLAPERPAPIGMDPAPTNPSDPQAPAVF